MIGHAGHGSCVNTPADAHCCAAVFHLASHCLSNPAHAAPWLHLGPDCQCVCLICQSVSVTHCTSSWASYNSSGCCLPSCWTFGCCSTPQGPWCVDGPHFSSMISSSEPTLRGEPRRSSTWGQGVGGTSRQAAVLHGQTSDFSLRRLPPLAHACPEQSTSKCSIRPAHNCGSNHEPQRTRRQLGSRATRSRCLLSCTQPGLMRYLSCFACRLLAYMRMHAAREQVIGARLSLLALERSSSLRSSCGLSRS